MEPLKGLIERLLPDLVVAAAAIGVFILLGAVVLISILFENWFAGWKHRPHPAHLPAPVENLQLQPALR